MSFKFTPYCCCGSTPPTEHYPCIPSCGLIFSGTTAPISPTFVQAYHNTEKWTIGLNVLDEVSTANICEDGEYFDVITVYGSYYDWFYIKHLTEPKTITANLVNLGNSWVYGIKYYCGGVAERRLENHDTGGRYDSTQTTPITVLIPTNFDPGVDYLWNADKLQHYEEYRLPFDYERYPFVFDENYSNIELPGINVKTVYFVDPSVCVTERSKARTEQWCTGAELEGVINGIKAQAQNGMDHCKITYFYVMQNNNESIQRTKTESARTGYSFYDIRFEASRLTEIGFFNDGNQTYSFLGTGNSIGEMGCIKTVRSSDVMPSNYDGDSSNYVGTPSTLVSNTTKSTGGHPISESILEFSDGLSIPERWVIYDGNFTYHEGSQTIEHYVGDKYDKSGTLSSRFSGRQIVECMVTNCSCDESTTDGSGMICNTHRFNTALFEVPVSASSWSDGGFYGTGGSTPLRKCTGSLVTTNFDTDRMLSYNNKLYSLRNRETRHLGSGRTVDKSFWIACEPYVYFRHSGSHHPFYIGSYTDNTRTVGTNQWPSICLIGKKSGDDNYYYIARCYIDGDCEGSACPPTPSGEYAGGNQHVKCITGTAIRTYQYNDLQYIVPAISSSDVNKMFPGSTIYASMSTVNSLSNTYSSVYCLIGLAVSSLYFYNITPPARPEAGGWEGVDNETNATGEEEEEEE